jgi:hypothetical protein
MPQQKRCSMAKTATPAPLFSLLIRLPFIEMRPGVQQNAAELLTVLLGRLGLES